MEILRNESDDRANKDAQNRELSNRTCDSESIELLDSLQC